MLGLTVTMNNALFETTQQTNAAATVCDGLERSCIRIFEPRQLLTEFLASNPTMMQFKADTSMGGGNKATITYTANS